MKPSIINYTSASYAIYLLKHTVYFVSLYVLKLSVPMTVFLSLEPYLAQWFINDCGGEVPVRLKRGSAECDILEALLQTPPKDGSYTPQLAPMEGQVEIVLPNFKRKDTRYYYYLSPRAAVVLHACIRNRFNVQLWKDLHTIGNVTKRNDIAISTWMKAHNIEDDEKNWNTIAKILQRKRAVYCAGKRLTDHKSSPHKKKVPKNATTSKHLCPPNKPEQ